MESAKTAGVFSWLQKCIKRFVKLLYFVRFSLAELEGKFFYWLLKIKSHQLTARNRRLSSFKWESSQRSSLFLV